MFGQFFENQETLIYDIDILHINFILEMTNKSLWKISSTEILELLRCKKIILFQFLFTHTSFRSIKNVLITKVSLDDLYFLTSWLSHSTIKGFSKKFLEIMPFWTEVFSHVSTMLQKISKCEVKPLLKIDDFTATPILRQITF